MWCGLRTRLRAPESWRSHAKWRTAHANGNVTLTPHIPVPLGRRLGTKVCCRTLHHRQRDTYVSKANANYNPPRICAHAALTLRSRCAYTAFSIFVWQQSFYTRHARKQRTKLIVGDDSHASKLYPHIP